MTSMPQTAVDVGFGLGRERRAFHAEIRAAAFHVDARGAAGRSDLPESCGQTGSAKLTCATRPSPKNVETRPRVRSKNWSGMTKSSGAVLFFERADGAQRDDPLHAQRLHAIDIGAEIQLRGRDAVSARRGAPGTRPAPGQLAEDVVVRRRAERACRSTASSCAFEAGHGVESAAADDADLV